MMTAIDSSPRISESDLLDRISKHFEIQIKGDDFELSSQDGIIKYSRKNGGEGFVFLLRKGKDINYLHQLREVYAEHNTSVPIVVIDEKKKTKEGLKNIRFYESFKDEIIAAGYHWEIGVLNG